MLKIHHAGIHTSVQDAGRSGFRQLGVSLCGALDLPALRTANLLVGNDQFAAGLEVTLGNFVAEFTSTGWVALTGAGCEATLAGKPLWTGWCFPVKPGESTPFAPASPWDAQLPCRQRWGCGSRGYGLKKYRS